MAFVVINKNSGKNYWNETVDQASDNSGVGVASLNPGYGPYMSALFSKLNEKSLNPNNGTVNLIINKNNPHLYSYNLTNINDNINTLQYTLDQIQRFYDELLNLPHYISPIDLDEIPDYNVGRRQRRAYGATLSFT